MGICASSNIVTCELENIVKDVTDDQHTRTNRFLHDLHEKQLKYTRSDEEVQCITQAVKEMVARLVSYVGEIDQKFEISHQHLVGSMAEGTRIQEPNEFDFIVILKHLSVPGVVEIQRASRISPSTYDIILAEIKLKNENLLKLYSSRVEDGYLSERIFNTCFSSCLKRSLKKCSKDMCIPTAQGHLSVHSPTLLPHGPAHLIECLWTCTSTSSTPLKICVDIVPAIEVEGLNDIVKPEDVDIAPYYKKLSQDNKYMLIEARELTKMNSKNLFKFTFTNSEVELVQVMSEHHKKCYRILKYCLLDVTVDKMKLFSSYTLKTFMLRHSAECNNETDIVHCFVVILSAISSSYISPIGLGLCSNARSIFMCGNHIGSKRLQKEDIVSLKEALYRIVRQLITIGKTEIDSAEIYDRNLREFEKHCYKHLPNKTNLKMMTQMSVAKPKRKTQTSLANRKMTTKTSKANQKRTTQTSMNNPKMTTQTSMTNPKMTTQTSLTNPKMTTQTSLTNPKMTTQMSMTDYFPYA